MDLRMSKITADANENIIDLIYEELKSEGKKYSELRLDFVAFEADQGTKFKLNNNSMEVPSTKKFVTPYEDDRHLIIRQFSFDSGCANQNIYYIL